MLKIFFYGRQDRDVELYKLYMRCVGYYVGTPVYWTDDEIARVSFQRDNRELESLSGIPTQEQIKNSFRKFF